MKVTFLKKQIYYGFIFELIFFISTGMFLALGKPLLCLFALCIGLLLAYWVGDKIQRYGSLRLVRYT